MAWRDTLVKLKNSVAETRADRLKEAKTREAERQEHRQELEKIVERLEIRQLLEEMNAVLLEGKGSLEVVRSWQLLDADEEQMAQELTALFGPQPGMLDDEGEDEDDMGGDVDFISSTLTWDEDGEREIAVDLGWDDDGLFLEVNGEESKQDKPALERVLVSAFKEELDL
ncbi:MAG: hypothetical protein FJ316_02780 [SAR202 cluster bacterium]|nr:hypothetical protein [SAR202 cluster bacterium]